MERWNGIVERWNSEIVEWWDELNLLNCCKLARAGGGMCVWKCRGCTLSTSDTGDFLSQRPFTYLSSLLHTVVFKSSNIDTLILIIIIQIHSKHLG